MSETGVGMSLPFSTTTTSGPAASFSSVWLLVGGSSPSNSWFTSPWMSGGRRSPSLLETVNLWLMVVAGETSDGSSCHGAGGFGLRKCRYSGPPSPPGNFASDYTALREQPLRPVIRCVIPTGASHQPVSAGCRRPGS